MNAESLLKILKQGKKLLSGRKQEVLIGTYFKYNYPKIKKKNLSTLIFFLGHMFPEEDLLFKLREKILEGSKPGEKIDLKKSYRVFKNNKDYLLGLLSKYEKFNKELLKFIRRHKLDFDFMMDYQTNKYKFYFNLGGFGHKPNDKDLLNKFYDYLLKKISNKLKDFSKKKRLVMFYPAIGVDWYPAKYFKLIALDLENIEDLKRITKKKIESYITMDVRDYEKLKINADVLMIKGINKKDILNDEEIVKLAKHITASFVIQFGVTYKGGFGWGVPRLKESTHKELIKNGFIEITEEIFGNESKDIKGLNKLLEDKEFNIMTGFFPGSEVRVYIKR